MSEDTPGNDLNPSNEKTPPLGTPSFPTSPEAGGDADFRARLRASGSRLWKQTLARWRATSLGQKLDAHLRDFEPAQAAEWASRAFQGQGSGVWLTGGTIVLCTFFLANLTSLLVGRFIPEPPAIRANRYNTAAKRVRSVDEYENVIAGRNLFNSKGEDKPKCPDPNNPNNPLCNGAPSGEPVKTTLPFNLVGTLILKDELRSIATIEDKSASQVYPVRVTDEIPSKARIIRVEPTRVVFVNLQSNRNEFVELPEDLIAIKNPKITLGGGGGKAGGPGIEKTGSNQFNVSRSEVDKALADPSFLTQARAIPNFENGVPAGFKLFQIVPGSIFAQLGLQNGDVIKGADGQPVNDLPTAMGMLDRLKQGTSHLELNVSRDGRTQNMAYDIR